MTSFDFLVQTELEHFENSLDVALSADVELVDDIARYMSKLKGKRLRPVLALLSAKAVRLESRDDIIDAAVALEMIHAATMVHDDVVDSAKMRRGSASINEKWSGQVAVLMGDFLLAKALNILVEIGDLRALSVVSKATQRLSVGEIFEIQIGEQQDVVENVKSIRQEVGKNIDLMVDVHGPPWLNTRDAIALGKRLEKYDLLFYEDPVAPENIEAISRVSKGVDLPIAAGERHATIWGVRELIEREIIDVVQPDTGRAGGLMQMKKMAALAEAHYCTLAPHDGSLGPVAEMAAVHIMATIPNFLILEHLADDVPQRYSVMNGQPEITKGFIAVPDTPGLGIDLVEEEISKYPSKGNSSHPDPTYGFQYIATKNGRASWLSGEEKKETEYKAGQVF